MKVRLTEAALMNMVKNAVMEVIKEEAMNEYFFFDLDGKKKKKPECPATEKACYPVADKKTKKSCPVVDKACYPVSKKKNEPKEKEQMNEWLWFHGMDNKDIEKAATDPEKDKKATNKKSTDKKSKKTTKKALNEFMAGGNDWGRTYDDYRMTSQTNAELDEIVRDLHTICQYFDDLYSVANENQRSKDFPKMQPQLAKYVVDLISPIYSLFANRTNRKGDRQGMTVEEIKSTCLDSLRQLGDPTYRNDLGVINSAAARALQALQTYTPKPTTPQNK